MRANYPENIIQMLIEDLDVKELKAIDYDIVKATITEDLDAIMVTFTPKERYIMQEYYLHNRPLPELAIDLGISRQRVYVIFRKINAKIKENRESILFGTSLTQLKAVQKSFSDLVADCINRLNALEKAKDEGRWDDVELIIGAERDNIYYQPLEKLNLKVRPYNCLKQIGIMTVKELCELTRSELLGIRNMGIGSVQDVENKLFDFGLRIRVK